MRMTCECGHVIPDTTDNLPYKAFIRLDVNEADVDSALQKALVSEIGEVVSAELIERVVRPVVVAELGDGVMYQCDQCGRLVLFVDSDSGGSWFVPEGDYCVDVLRHASVKGCES